MNTLLIVLIVLVSIVIVLNIILLTRKQNNNDILKDIMELRRDITKEIGNFKYDFSKSLSNDFDKITSKIENRLDVINDRVNQRLDDSLEKTNKTFANILERLSKIDEAQKNIDLLSKDIISLQSVLTDKKTRGTFGEINLNYILTSIFGEKKEIYDLQHKMSNGFIADSILYAPEPLGTIAIDSKFPLENYEKMTNRSLDKSVREEAYKKFKQDVKKHIDDISSKYIISGETSKQAIMFLPAEAVFAELNAYHEDLLKYAYSKNVWICGPTTLMATLSTIGMILKNIERNKYTEVIHEELNKLGIEFKRYKDRWTKLNNSIESVSKEVKEINITTDKITNRFEKISNADVKALEYTEE